MEDMWRPMLVAALEFGTTDARLAFSLRRKFDAEPLTITNISIWPAWTGYILSKETPTCLLLDREKKCVAFGYEAEKRYAELLMDEEQDDYYFFDRFTMSLLNNENVTRDKVLKDKTGKQCSAEGVFKLSIKALANRLIKILECGEYMHDEVLWVLTVPSAWTDSAKQLIRESAEKAGINPKKLLLVNEAEAAFTYCHYLPTTRLQGSKPGHMIKEPGTKSMVVDLGDVTADITVLQSTYNGKLKELFRMTRNDCCGSSVDDRYCNMLEEIAGGKVISELKEKTPLTYRDLVQCFNLVKQDLRTETKRHVSVKIPLCSIDSKCHEFEGKSLRSAIDSSLYVNEITVVGDKLRFKADLMIKLFTPTIDSIIAFMKNTLSNRSTNDVSNNVSNILMVGAFSECPMIQEAVYKAFPDNQIIIPDYPGDSVVNGAVLFGHRPDYNRSELCDEEGIGK